MISVDSIEQPSSVDTRRYWAGVGLFILALIAASVVVIVQGTHAGVRARRLVPVPDSVVSVQPFVRVFFARPIDKASVEPAIAISPEVEFRTSWIDNELRILPQEALRPETVYAIRIGPGIRDRMGNQLQGTLEWRFRTRQPRILFLAPAHDGSSELWMTGVKGENRQRISSPGQLVQDFDSTPDGEKIVFTVDEGQGNVNLWTADLNRHGLDRLTEAEGTMFGAPRFSPTGDLLAVEVRPEVMIGDRGQALAPPRLELRRPGNGSPAGMIYGQGSEVAHSPRWSPDGTRIAFFEANRNAVGLFNFTDDVRFFPAESARLGEQPWSPDGKSLVYTTIQVTGQSAQQVIVVRNLQQGTESIHAETIGDQGDAAWSPDGAWIAYSYQSPDGGTVGNGIWLMRPDGSDRTLLVAEPNVIYSLPLWSPDGEWILFGRFDLTTPQTMQSLWAIRRDGSDLHRVAEAGFQAAWMP